MQKYVGSISMPSTPAHEWPQVIHEGVLWLVSPVYVSPVARVDLDVGGLALRSSHLGPQIFNFLHPKLLQCRILQVKSFQLFRHWD